MNKKLVLENGIEFYGKSFGSDVDCVAQLIFVTSMIGYQEILTDPSYANQMVVMTYPLIGNYGIIEDDNQSKIMPLTALIVREYNDKPSNFRYTKTVAEVLEENNVAGLAQIDTRKLTRILRSEGSMKGIICDVETSVETALKNISEHVVDTNVIQKLSVKKTWYSRTSNYNYNVVVIDCGGYISLIKSLNNLGCNVTVVPYDYSSEKILALKADGVVISNGAGNPYDATQVIETIKELQNKMPMLGVGFGYLLIGIANGLKVSEMKCGHHGKNYPVLDVITNKIEMTAQNHSYVIDSVDEKVSVCKVNAMDKTIEGIIVNDSKCMGVSYYPNAHLSNNAYIWLIDQIKKSVEEAK